MLSASPRFSPNCIPKVENEKFKEIYDAKDTPASIPLIDTVKEGTSSLPPIDDSPSKSITKDIKENALPTIELLTDHGQSPRKLSVDPKKTHLPELEERASLSLNNELNSSSLPKNFTRYSTEYMKNYIYGVNNNHDLDGESQHSVGNEDSGTSMPKNVFSSLKRVLKG